MNETTLTQMKIIVERAVRPVRAGTRRKRYMREELLAHVNGVFKEESAKLGDDRAALEQTALRFGNPALVTRQLQESVPASDNLVRLLEGRPDGSILSGALRFAWIEGTIFLGVIAAVMFLTGWLSPWSREEPIALLVSFGFLPFWLVMPLWLLGITLVAHWMEPSLHGSETLTGWPRIGLSKFLTSAWAVPKVRAALIAGSICMLGLAYIGGFTWPLQRADWRPSTVLATILLAGTIAASTLPCAWFLVQTVDERRRRHEEWASLPIEA